MLVSFGRYSKFGTRFHACVVLLSPDRDLQACPVYQAVPPHYHSGNIHIRDATSARAGPQGPYGQNLETRMLKVTPGILYDTMHATKGWMAIK